MAQEPVANYGYRESKAMVVVLFFRGQTHCDGDYTTAS